MNRLRIVELILLLLFVYHDLFPQPSSKSQAEARAIWVTRWDFKTPEDIRKIVRNVADHHFNIIFFQVRGTGTAYYRSQFEPWAWNHGLSGNRWDPLADAIEAAHEARIQLHAWINVYPGWSGFTPPLDSTQLWRAHPDWFIMDMDGHQQSLNNHYVWLSPTHPEVRQHLLKIFDEIIQRYNVDGIHLDYVRYPGPGYSYDSASVQQFINDYRYPPQNLPLEWEQFRRDAITHLIDSLSLIIQQNKPDVLLSSAVVRNYRMGKRLYLQEVHGWLSRGIMDFVAPMIYTANRGLFEKSLGDHLQHSLASYILPAIQVTDDPTLIAQIELCRQKGVLGHGVFSYQSLFPNHQPNTTARLLKSSCYCQRAALPRGKPQPSDRKRCVVSNIQKIPENVREGEEINVRCQIANIPQHAVVYLKWSEDRKPIPLSRVSAASDYFITTYGIPPQKKGTRLTLKLLVNQEVLSDHLLKLFINSQDEIFSQVAPMGPLIYNAQFIVVDRFNRAWVCERGKNRVRVINPDGSEANISPIIEGRNVAGRSEPLQNPSGIAIDTQGIVYVTGQPAKGLIFKYHSLTAEPLESIKVPFYAGEIDVDAQGNLYVIEMDGNCWHLFDENGKELIHSPFFGSHLSQGIAVNREGTKVYVACQVEGTVHCWEGKVDHGAAMFHQISDLFVDDVGLGTVDLDRQGNIYVSQIDAGSVSIFDEQGQFVAYLKGEKPPLCAPRGVGFAKDGSFLYIVEWGIESPMRLQKWRRY